MDKLEYVCEQLLAPVPGAIFHHKTQQFDCVEPQCKSHVQATRFVGAGSARS